MTEDQRRATVDRDSVCAGDDCESHAASFLTSSSVSAIEFLQEALRASPLAGIAGGQATWLIDTAGAGQACIGVIAEQWARPRLLIDEQTSVEKLFGERAATVYFRYLCQASPEAVFEALRAGKALPPRFGP